MFNIFKSADFSVYPPGLKIQPVVQEKLAMLGLKQLGIDGMTLYEFPFGYEHFRRKEKGLHRYILYFPREGELYLQSSEKKGVIKPGMFALHSTNLRYLKVLNCELYRGLHCRLDYSMGKIQRAFPNDELIIGHIDNINSLFMVAEACRLESSMAPPGIKSETVTHLVSTMASIIERNVLNSGSVINDTHHIQLNKLWQSVRFDLSVKWTLKKLAKNAGLSVPQFYRLVDKYYQTQPMKMVLEMRMKHAQTLLLETDLPLKQIAEAVGFSDAYSFSKAFKRYCGNSPGKFRKNTSLPE